MALKYKVTVIKCKYYSKAQVGDLRSCSGYFPPLLAVRCVKHRVLCLSDTAATHPDRDPENSAGVSCSWSTDLQSSHFLTQVQLCSSRPASCSSSLSQSESSSRRTLDTQQKLFFGGSVVGVHGSSAETVSAEHTHTDTHCLTGG